MELLPKTKHDEDGQMECSPNTFRLLHFLILDNLLQHLTMLLETSLIRV